jgi:hypothetical protein
VAEFNNTVVEFANNLNLYMDEDDIEALLTGGS